MEGKGAIPVPGGMRLARLSRMQIPVEVTFRDMPHWDAVEQDILDRAERLERFYDKITSCRVVIGQMW